MANMRTLVQVGENSDWLEIWGQSNIFMKDNNAQSGFVNCSLIL